MKDFQAAIDQAAAEVTEPGAQDATGGGDDAAAIEGSQGDAQDAGQESSATPESLLEKTDLPPELEDTRKSLLRDYHAKLKGFSEKERQMQSELGAAKEDSATLRQLVQTDWFRSALDSYRAGKNGNAQNQAPLEMSDEQFENIRSDKRAFEQYVSSLAEKVADKKYSREIETHKRELGRIGEEREIELLSGKYPGFKELNESGALKPYLQKGLTYKLAYAEAMLDNPQPKAFVQKTGDLQVEAERLITQKKQGSVPQSGFGTRGKLPVVNVKKGSLDDIIDKVSDLVEKGQDPNKYEFNRV